MKKLFLVFALLCALVLTPALVAAEIDYGYVSKSGTGTTSADVVFPRNTAYTLRLISLDVRTDLASSTVKLYGGTADYTVSTAALSTATNIIVTSSGSAASNDVAVIQASDGSTFTATIHGNVGGTNLQFSGQLGTAVAAGATVHRMDKVHTLYPTSTNEFRLHAECIFAPQLRQPLLVRATGTSSVKINNASVHYD